MKSWIIIFVASVFACFIFSSLILIIIIYFGEVSSIVALSILYSLNIITIFIIFIRNRYSEAKLSWIVVVVFVPLVGVVLYFIFGQKYRYRMPKDAYDKKLNNFFKYQLDNDFSDVESNSHLKKLVDSQIFYSKKHIQKAHVEMFSDISIGFDHIFEDLLNAKKSIYIHFYIIKPGEVYDKFKQIIEIKSKEKIDIIMILDDFGSWTLPKSEFYHFRSLGVKIYIFGKVYFPFIGSNNGYRTHRKMIIIDNVILHTGGSNISDEYISYSKKYGWWLDLNMRIQGPFVQQYALLFAYDWFNFTNQSILNSIKKINYLEDNIQQNNTSALLVEVTPENTDSVYENSLIKWISHASNNIKISTPYLILTSSIFNALKNALLSGVNIEIFLPGLPDKKVTYIASLYYAKELKKYGAKVYILNNMFLHTKMFCFDDQYVYIGTGNLDIRSMYSQLETLNLFFGETIVSKSNDIFNNYRRLSTIYNKTKTNKFIEFFIKFFSPMM